MPDISEDTATVTTYPPEVLYRAWQAHADELDMSTSRFIIEMVEAGRKQVEMDDVATESLHELQQRNVELQEELDRQRQRVRQLERQLNRTEHSDIVEFVGQNTGATMTEIIQHVADTIPARVASHLDLLEGDVLRQTEDGYYPVDDSTAENRDETNRESNTHETTSSEADQ